jgi:hypothetical protein
LSNCMNTGRSSRQQNSILNETTSAIFQNAIWFEVWHLSQNLLTPHSNMFCLKQDIWGLILWNLKILCQWQVFLMLVLKRFIVAVFITTKKQFNKSHEMTTGYHGKAKGPTFHS